MTEMAGRVRGTGLLEALRRHLPRGGLLEDAEWRRRHRLLLWVLAAHLPALTTFGLAAGWSAAVVLPVVVVLGAVTWGGAVVRRRRTAMWLVSLGLTTCSVALVAFSYGSIEAHFHFFIIVGFLALYQDWFPFLWNVTFTVLSHGIGSALVPGLIFGHAGHENPWMWSLLHGMSVLACCAGVLLFWHCTEAVQNQRVERARRLAEAEIGRTRFTSDLLLDLARRNQSVYQRQLDIINDLEAAERDPDVLAHLVRLDHLATRVRRNAESLLVLSGEQPARVWSPPVALRDVVRAAIAETEDLGRIESTVDEQLTVLGDSVADLTHLLAELLENAVRFSPPTEVVTIAGRPYHLVKGAHMLVVEDTGVGMPVEDRQAANSLLARPEEVDVSASRQLGFHVVTRLAARHGVGVSLIPSPGCGVTAVVILPTALFATRPNLGRRPTTPSLAPARSLGVMPGQEAVRASRAGSSSGRASESLLVDGHGRHAWPGSDGAGDSDDRDGHDGLHGLPGPQVPGQAARAHGTHERPGPEDDDRTGPTPTTPEQRSTGRLVCPITVPPPRAPMGDPPPTTPGSATHGATRSGDATAAPETADPGPGVPVGTPGAPAPRTPADPPLSGGRTLRRRVPQTHLAPELAGAGAAHGSGAGTPSDTMALAPASRQDALGALSRYQASRRWAQDELDGTDSAGSEPSGTERTGE